MRKRNLRLAAGLLTVGLIAAACGSDRGDDEATPTTTATPVATGETGATGDTGSTGETGATGPDTATGEKFGDLASPCGEGDAAGATDKGVTDTSITIGYGDDAGYAASPGLNKEMADAMKAIIDWCNDLGGINGREVVGNYYDGKLLEVKNAMTQACTDEVFMLVGEGWALDASQEDVRIGCELSAIPGYSVSTAFAHGPGMVQSVPNPGDQTPMSAAYQLAELFPESISKMALVYADYSATLETQAKVKAAFPAAGYTILDCDQIYNIGGEPDWTPFVDALKACGAEIVYWVGSPAPNFQNLLDTAKIQGYAPKAYVTDANHYDASFAAWNAESGGAGDSVYVRMAFVPFEEADKNPATKQYIDLIGESGGKQGLLGTQSIASFLLWATGVQACGSDVTDACVLDEIANLTDWTAGGLHVPTQPGLNTAPNCGLLVKLAGDTFERVAPTDKTFECDPKFQATNLQTQYVTEAKLDANRVATQFGQFTP